MEYDSIEKADHSWNDISIMRNGDGIDIFLLFKDMKDGAALFERITKINPIPSFICTCLPDGTHNLKIDYSPDNLHEEFIQSHCRLTIDKYPPLAWLKEKNSFRVVIGMKQENKIMGSALVFLPEKVQYINLQKQSGNLN